MGTGTVLHPAEREPALRGRTVVLIGGSGGIGLETSDLRRWTDVSPWPKFSLLS